MTSIVCICIVVHVLLELNNVVSKLHQNVQIWNRNKNEETYVYTVQFSYSHCELQFFFFQLYHMALICTKNQSFPYLPFFPSYITCNQKMAHLIRSGKSRHWERETWRKMAHYWWEQYTYSFSMSTSALAVAEWLVTRKRVVFQELFREELRRLRRSIVYLNNVNNACIYQKGTYLVQTTF